MSVPLFRATVAVTPSVMADGADSVAVGATLAMVAVVVAALVAPLTSFTVSVTV